MEKKISSNHEKSSAVSFCADSIGMFCVSVFLDAQNLSDGDQPNFPASSGVHSRPAVLAELSRSLQHFPLAAVYRKLFYHQHSFCSRFGIHQFPVRFWILQNPVETAEPNFYRSALQHDASLCRYHHSHLLGLERRGRRGYLLAPDSPLLVRRRSHVYLLAAPVLSVYSKGTG